MTLVNTINLSLEMTRALTSIEVRGIKIDTETLKKLKQDYQVEMVVLYKKLDTMIKEAMGDTPVNLDSGEDRSVVMYSCKVKDKSIWKSSFNLGTEVKRGGGKRAKRKPNFSRGEFQRMVATMTDVAYKTKVQQCSRCYGKGTIKKYTVKGDLYKIAPKCPTCNGKGVIYISTGEVAGFKLVPTNVLDCTVNGFKTDMGTASKHITESNPKAKEFLQSYTRYSAIRTYLRTFIEGIEKGLDPNNFIHPQFMQCVTSTGRLSSRNPNFQNMPRGATFPVRKAIISRFKDGLILEGDYRQLEFRVAGFLSQDKRVYEDVRNNVDVHQYTADTMGVSRQDAKAHTFKPLYGGVLGTPKEMKYYEAFKQKYWQVNNWHYKLQQEAVTTKKIALPSGREYAFPEARWTRYGNVTNSTAIKNYPVQGFATADLLPLALVILYDIISKNNLKSVICNTVHDSIILDVHPDEKDECINYLREAMLSIRDECKKRYNIDYDMPIDIELKIGKNWLELEEI